MTDNANKAGDQGGDGVRPGRDKSSEILSKDSPEVNVSNVRAAQKANPNKTDTVSPDGKSRFQLTDDASTATKRGIQEEAYKSAGLGDPNEAIGKPSAISEIAITERPQEITRNTEGGPAKVVAGANLFKGSLYADGLPVVAKEQYAPNDRIEIAQIMPPRIRPEEKDYALKTLTGEIHGIVNFAVNTASGVGDLLRMADAADRKVHPVRALLPDLDPEGTKKLQDACAGVSMGTRVLVQYGTTLNPESNAFYGKDFDPEARQVAQKLAATMPERLRKEVEDFKKAPVEQRAAKGTELLLDLYTLAETGVAGFSKAGQIVSESKMLSQISNETKTFASKLKEFREDKLNQLADFMTSDNSQFAAEGPGFRQPARKHLENNNDKKASFEQVNRKVESTIDELEKRTVGPIEKHEGQALADALRAELGTREKQNIAVAQIAIDGHKPEGVIAVSGEKSPKGTLEAPEHRKFKITEYDGAITHAFDTEVKILEKVAKQLEKTPDAQGTINLFTERYPCTSCIEVIDQFKSKFKNIDINISYTKEPAKRQSRRL